MSRVARRRGPFGGFVAEAHFDAARRGAPSPVGVEGVVGVRGRPRAAVRPRVGGGREPRQARRVAARPPPLISSIVRDRELCECVHQVVDQVFAYAALVCGEQRVA